MTRDDEISFGITDSFSVLDIFRSFVDHAFVDDFELRFFLASSFSVDFVSMGFDFSSIYAFDVVPNRYS